MKDKKFKIVFKYNYVTTDGVTLSAIPCDLFDDCADVITPSQSMLQLQAGGMALDLQRRKGYYSDDELKEYEKYNYAVDYVQEWKDFKAKMDIARMNRKNESLKRSANSSNSTVNLQNDNSKQVNTNTTEKTDKT